MKQVYVIVFMYRGRIYCKIGHGGKDRLATFRSQSPFEVQVITSHFENTVADPRDVEREVHKHFDNIRLWKMLPNTTEVFDTSDVEQVLEVMQRAIVDSEARAIPKNKHAPRFMQITPSMADIDKICAYAVAQAPKWILLLDDRNGEVKRGLIAAGYNAQRIVSIDTRDGYPEAFMKFDLIIMNPPYSSGIDTVSGKRNGGNSTAWLAFTASARRLLKDDGILVLLAPVYGSKISGFEYIDVHNGVLPLISFANSTQYATWIALRKKEGATAEPTKHTASLFHFDKLKSKRADSENERAKYTNAEWLDYANFSWALNGSSHTLVVYGDEAQLGLLRTMKPEISKALQDAMGKTGLKSCVHIRKLLGMAK